MLKFWKETRFLNPRDHLNLDCKLFLFLGAILWYSMMLQNGFWLIFNKPNLLEILYRIFYFLESEITGIGALSTDTDGSLLLSMGQIETLRYLGLSFIPRT